MKKPSVTDLCDLLNKPQLLKWANKLGLDGKDLDTYNKDKLKLGTKKHSEIEDYLLNGVSLNDAYKEEKLTKMFNNSEILSIEESFENEQYKGRVDIIFIKDGLTYIGDFKSSFKRPYIEHYIQLVSYKMHYNADRICIIDLKNIELFDITTIDEPKYIELINCLIKIYNIKQLL